MRDVAARGGVKPAPAQVTARVGRAVRAELVAWLPGLPLIALVASLLITPALLLVVQSLGGSDGPTFHHWIAALGSRVGQRAVSTSLALAALSATISTLVGAPLAWIVSRGARGRRAVWLALLNVWANFGGIGLGFAYLATLGTAGMVTLSLQGLGVSFRAPSPSSFIGLVLAYQYNNIPLFVLLTLPAMGVVRDELWEAAQTSSATRGQFWRYVGLPLLAPFVAGGWLLIFTWSIGIYGIAYALAGTGGASGVRLMTLEIGRTLQASVFGQERAAVLAVLLMAIAAISLLAYRALLRRALRWL